MEEFWARQDPEGTRLQEPVDELEPRDSSNQIEHAIEATSPRGSRAGSSGVRRGPAKRRQSKRAPEVNNTSRAQKPPALTSSVNKNTRRSLGSRKDIEHQERSNQAQKDTTAASSSDRHTRRQRVENAPERQEASLSQKGNIKAKAQPPTPARKSRATAHTPNVTLKASQSKGTREAAQAIEDTAPPKRRHGQRSAKGKPSTRTQTREKQKTPVVQDNAKVKKSERLKKPSAAPSVHTMRTRARGTAEKIEIT